jgi:hypothetical protein
VKSSESINNHCNFATFGSKLSGMLKATIVQHTDELRQILELQQQNLKQHVSEEEKKEQGFVTMKFTLPMLEAMHTLAPSIIVKDRDKVIAYAIVFLPEGRRVYPAIVPLLDLVETLEWNGTPLNRYRYYIMGQICVAKEYRGRGVVKMLYDGHREAMHHEYDLIVTEISTSNHRSIKAHERIGFVSIHTYRDELDEWSVVAWDWQVASG